MKKTVIGIFILILAVSSVTFATNEDTTTSDTQSQEKLENMKKSNIDKMIEYEPVSENDKTLTEGVTELERKLDYARIVATRILQKNGRILVIIISVFSLIAYAILKAMKVKSMQKTALFFVIMPVVFYIFYSYLNPFLSTLE